MKWPDWLSREPTQQDFALCPPTHSPEQETGMASDARITHGESNDTASPPLAIQVNGVDYVPRAELVEAEQETASWRSEARRSESLLEDLETLNNSLRTRLRGQADFINAKDQRIQELTDRGRERYDAHLEEVSQLHRQVEALKAEAQSGERGVTTTLESFQGSQHLNSGSPEIAVTISVDNDLADSHLEHHATILARSGSPAAVARMLSASHLAVQAALSASVDDRAGQVAPKITVTHEPRP